jgi:hypothetical protein
MADDLTYNAPTEVFYLGRREGVKSKTVCIYQTVAGEERLIFKRPIGIATVVGARYRLLGNGKGSYLLRGTFLAPPQDDDLTRQWILEDEAHAEKVQLAKQVKTLTDAQLRSMTLQQIITAASYFNRGDRALVLARIARFII